MKTSRTLFFLRHFCLWLYNAQPKESLAVGGQAVMDGIMLRNGNHLAIAVRKPDDSIVVVKHPWKTFFSKAITTKKWLRGFPILIETMINGIKALNISAELSAGSEEEKIKSWQLALTLFVSMALAMFIFVAVPHLLTMALSLTSLSGAVEKISFQIWDGLIKFLIFIGYIVLIGRMPDIQRVFQYHGAEHKTISAYEKRENPVTAESAKKYSRLHPRCGTTFLFFVLSVSILIHIITVPTLTLIWSPSNGFIKHFGIILFKILLAAPISAVAYEIIRTAANMKNNSLGAILRFPGLMLQRLTTREPNLAQLEVGVAALKEALGGNTKTVIEPPKYTLLEHS